MRQNRLRRSPVAWLAVGLMVSACAGSGGGSTPATLTASAAAGSRPSSPAVVRILQPASGAELQGTSVHVAIALDNARIVPATSTDLRPDEGHLHLYVDNAIVSMNYGLEQDVPVHPGTYLLKVEFVAADHAPFNPRVWSDEIVFTVP